MTPKQLIFVSEYLMSGNATQAYKLAYGVQDDDVAAAGASRLLRNVKVVEYLKEFRNNITMKTEITVEKTVEEIAKVAFSNIADVLKAKKVKDLPEHVQAAIAEITVTDTKQGKKRTIKLHNKLTALDMLMKHFGGYVTVQDIINKLDEEDTNKIHQYLLEKIKDLQDPS
ncbi:terminase small subunit [Cytophagaceae bacterium DM2B3-1]|uniref:Terminase small subunit n=1 Tax=Xanthocytophaga flava TaxID=3048013 RepID=A0ABT7CS60_9BACT|nr:terminase small subunit [Xanthocytophaga flavus]MDJ1496555.1 terminase small subunit [Xanthocytophaga flavus]